ncbi:hypothetical protein PMIN01_08313 [Paraphaeosphaeria minitans]|uniref:Uncharacterized protein n=1 Tax=Paraphaeosphaeria minitans TaxID=565426 RepID=A0A9P6GGI1_9PLEO|nr:hypothetical protein PMIN01_08313 [Paraphaeosphaeria minitans]
MCQPCTPWTPWTPWTLALDARDARTRRLLEALQRTVVNPRCNLDEATQPSPPTAPAHRLPQPPPRYPLPIAYCLLPIAHCPLPTAHCPVPIAPCLRRPSSRCSSLARTHARTPASASDCVVVAGTICIVSVPLGRQVTSVPSPARSSRSASKRLRPLSPTAHPLVTTTTHLHPTYTLLRSSQLRCNSILTCPCFTAAAVLFTPPRTCCSRAPKPHARQSTTAPNFLPATRQHQHQHHHHHHHHRRRRRQHHHPRPTLTLPTTASLRTPRRRAHHNDPDSRSEPSAP